MWLRVRERHICFEEVKMVLKLASLLMSMSVSVLSLFDLVHEVEWEDFWSDLTKLISPNRTERVMRKQRRDPWSMCCKTSCSELQFYDNMSLVFLGQGVLKFHLSSSPCCIPVR